LSLETFIADTKKTATIEFKRLGYRLVFVISPDGLECSCLYDPNPMGAPLSHEELWQCLVEAKIQEGIDEDALQLLLDTAKAGKPIHGLLIARGTPMIPGADGRLEFVVRSASADDDPDGDDGQFDFRNIQQFLNVAAGDLIGTVLDPGEGIPGISVFGSEIPAERGRELVIKPGKNVRIDGPSVYAAADGRVYYHGDELSVEDVYTVAGDVDFKVGNIVYNGFLEVKGDVLDGFVVKASKGIRIQGNIGTCTIESDGAISCCGMAGQERGYLRCGGTLTANFIHDTKIECVGDILVETELRNCDIKTLGMVKVNKGVIVGGTCIAMGGVEAAVIGSPASVFTRIVTGVNYHDLEELNRLFNELKQLLEQVKNVKDRHSAAALMKQRTAITDSIQQLRSRNYETANAKVNVKKKLFERVNITLSKISEEIREERPGPLSIIANTIEGGMRFLSMTDLSVKASQIEAIYVQEAERMRQQQAATEMPLP
jgi:uncharacterized protein (DUF342 family)